MRALVLGVARRRHRSRPRAAVPIRRSPVQRDYVVCLECGSGRSKKVGKRRQPPSCPRYPRPRLIGAAWNLGRRYGAPSDEMSDQEISCYRLDVLTRLIAYWSFWSDHQNRRADRHQAPPNTNAAIPPTAITLTIDQCMHRLRFPEAYYGGLAGRNLRVANTAHPI